MIKYWLQNSLMHLFDWVFSIIPRHIPKLQQLENCKIIAHRGEHQQAGLIENTLPAFAAATDAGVWGIECDIRWTADLVPVIAHDADGSRLYACPRLIADLSFAELRTLMPEVPSLQELVSALGKKSHLMLEIKDEAYPDPPQQASILNDLLNGLVPGEDYHFLALDPRLFERVDFVSTKCCILVSELNPYSTSRNSLELDLGGLTGHFLLLNNRLKHRHESAGQKFGTGFITSRNCLFRELNRDVCWIFTNHALKIQNIRDKAIEYYKV